MTKVALNPLKSAEIHISNISNIFASSNVDQKESEKEVVSFRR